MSFILGNFLIVLALFSVMLVVQEWGRRHGERHRLLDPASDGRGYGVTEGAVFGLLGLFLAFTFSSAGTRFDARRQLIVQEANAIGTAWLRIDLLPEDTQPVVRGLLREYLDARLEIYRLVAAGRPIQPALAKSASLQQQIWSTSVSASGRSSRAVDLLDAFDEMIGITRTRAAATDTHSPIVIYVMIGILAIVGSAFVGHGMAGRKVRSGIHIVGFAAVMAVVVYVIIDLDFPRVGVIRVDAADQVLVDLRRSMD